MQTADPSPAVNLNGVAAWWGQISPIQILIPASSASGKEPGNRLEHHPAKSASRLKPSPPKRGDCVKLAKQRAFNAPASFLPISARLPQLRRAEDQLDPY
ncbi:hypothetical protein PGT21_027932 [Puccinia graminis f. sp. tritici]|uniref:Uncharacterized protein n=1 Tax=Puccinia graminis f. sp. tritici TaxID=56615 RepID=A0A5B0P3N7_PUCGR|nr:hypothetical protein PGT21_027932 [Puccinia graminis f. sp. tritici]KAA1128917.1 hypothetical protein PGTUg99_003340 [Puccinia graminis f. sp. tritici]